MKVKYICSECSHGDDVVWDAYATWDVEKQKYILHSSFDEVECMCGCRDIKEIEENNNELE
tara:strand:- start:193 stop:375 length:183 start_codon:yes stop_codon:yes gene_type:complete